MKWLTNNWLIIVILLVSLFLRTYRIADTMTFLEDEGRDMLIAKRMIDTGRPVLLGPQTSTGNMYLGPFYYYFITPALYLSGMAPVGPAILIAITGVITTYLLYIFTNKYFGKLPAYMASLMFAVLPFSVSVTRSSWNPNLVPLISVLMLLNYFSIYANKAKKINWIYHGILIGVMVQLHYMALVYCAAVSMLIVWDHRKQLTPLLKGIGLSFAGFTLMLIPFIVFELRNNWVNTHALTRFLEAKEERNIRYDLPAWLWWDKVSSTSYRLIGNTLIGSETGNKPFLVPVITIFFSLLILGLSTNLKTKNYQFLRLLVILAISLAVLGIYQENIHMHYLEFAIPLIILSLATLVAQVYNKYIKIITTVFILSILYIGGRHSLIYVNSGKTYQVEKAKIITDYIASKANGRAYNLVSSPQTSTSPYQYFAFSNIHPPSNKMEKLIYMICQNQECDPSELQNPYMFFQGPSHPTLDNYIGHPLATVVAAEKHILSNEHVFIGIWVAEIVLE